MFKDKEINKNINITKPFEIGQTIKIENIEKKILDIDKNNNVLVDVQIIDNQGNPKLVKQWYSMILVELI